MRLLRIILRVYLSLFLENLTAFLACIVGNLLLLVYSDMCEHSLYFTHHEEGLLCHPERWIVRDHEAGLLCYPGYWVVRDHKAELLRHPGRWRVPDHGAGLLCHPGRRIVPDHEAGLLCHPGSW